MSCLNCKYASIIKQTQLKDSALRKRYINIAFWPIILIVVSIIQLFIAELPILCLGSTIVVLALYIYNQDSFIFMDALTGVSNRNMLKKYFDDLKLKSKGSYYTSDALTLPAESVVSVILTK